MYQITVCQSIAGTGSVILTKTLAVFYEETYPEDLDAILEEFGGDFIDIVYEEIDSEW